ncbi:hypothetical protein BC940DRAFT_291911 [Gongronella butleri]|nr:hypothetical protein BC940DRAFT_291911 [Gongronella butleri]
MGKKTNRASQLFQSGPKWKREFVADHKFDYIDVEEFRTSNCLYMLRYFIMYIAIIISILAYAADIWSAGILLIYNQWSLSEKPVIPLDISKWIFVGCIILSFMILAWDIRKARMVLATRDISYAVCNNIVFRYLSVKSYSNFCMFLKIQSSRRFSDSAAFYVFFTLKGWKRLFIAQGPRQIIAGITAYAIYKSAWTNENTNAFEITNDWTKYGKDWQQRISLFLLTFTCLYWVLNMLALLLAVLLYFPVYCQIQGNLKEYCCHKIDKRITEILEKQRRKRTAKDRKKGGPNRYNPYNDKKNHMYEASPEPTLPVLDEPSDPYSDKRPLHNDYYYSEMTTYAINDQPMAPPPSHNFTGGGAYMYEPSYSPAPAYQQGSYASSPASTMRSPPPQRPFHHQQGSGSSNYPQQTPSPSLSHASASPQQPHRQPAPSPQSRAATAPSPQQNYNAYQSSPSPQGRPLAANQYSNSPAPYHQSPFPQYAAGAGSPAPNRRPQQGPNHQYTF